MKIYDMIGGCMVNMWLCGCLDYKEFYDIIANKNVYFIIFPLLLICFCLFFVILL